MKNINKQKDKSVLRSVSVKNINLAVMVLSLIIFVIMAYFTVLIPIATREMSEYDRQLHMCETEAMQVQRGRSYLTRQSRLYIQNLDETYLDAYIEEVRDSRRIQIAFENLSTCDFTDEIKQSLANLALYTEQLMEYECYAMKLVSVVNGVNEAELPQEIASVHLSAEHQAISSQEKLELARTYVFGTEYQNMHNNFEAQLVSISQLITDSLEADHAAVNHRINVAATHQRVCICLLGLLVAVSSLWDYFTVSKPIGEYVDSIKSDRPLRVTGAKELRRLAEGYNELYLKNAADKDELLSRAELDSLTGLINQRAFSQLKEELKSHKEPLALLVLDVDRFKQINDEYGHDVGDAMLQKFAVELRNTVNPTDRIARLGGDEFVVVMFDVGANDVDVIRSKIDLLNENLMKPQLGLPIISCSVGVAFSDGGYNDELFHFADQAMYFVKRRGGCGLHVYDGTENVHVIAEESALQSGKQRILIVDDSKINRDLLTDILEEDYDIVQAENGAKAIEILEHDGNSFALMLLDLFMPECDGFQVLEYMKQYRWNDILPVIVISAETDPDVIAKAYDMGVMDYIGRPFSAVVVSRRVKNTVSFYLRHKRLAGIVFRQIQEQVDSFDQMLHILSQVVEFRNNESARHVKRIDLITELLLERLMQKPSKYALTVAQARLIRRASILHDIGKIAIPDEIINKPGRLTDEEFAVIKTHSMEGATILERSGNVETDPLMHTAYEICRWHHERYDGKGYPDGLVGDEIPISAQVVSLADVYDALTSDRCYKKAYTHQEALTKIFRGDCGAFNPLLLECLADIAATLPEKLNDTSENIARRRENEYLVEELSKKDALGYSNRLLNQLTFETVRADFFGKATSDKTFYYKVETDELLLSREAAEMLGTKEIIRRPLEYAGSSDNCNFDKIDWRTLCESLSPEKPNTAVTVTMKCFGEMRQCRCVLRSVWTAGNNPTYLGVVGVLITL